jgi:hypothetical protein
MEVSNHASRAVAQKWCREFIESAFEINIRQAKERPPKPMDGITVREIEPKNMKSSPLNIIHFIKTSIYMNQSMQNR